MRSCSTSMRSWLCSLVVLVLASTASAQVRTRTIEYSHGDLQLVGYLAFDAAIEGPRPGVLIVHEWWGLNTFAKDRARQLAEAGYVAFAVDMYGDGRTTSEVPEAQRLATPFYQDRNMMRARAAAGLTLLQRQEQVDADQIAVIGYCFGGTVALELARSGAPVRGAVSFHGGLGTPDTEDAKKIRGKVLVLHGAVDPLVPPEEVAAFSKEMEDANVDYQLIAYGGAVHSFTNPRAGRAGIPGVEYHREADERSWRHMMMFFDEIFAEQPGQEDW